jgi:SAM-dependent methyltransferase
MAEAGYDMVGLDNDPGMLAILKESLSLNLVQQTHIVAGDFTSFCFRLRFPLIILPCNTYSTLSARRRQAILERAHQHLLPGGIFAASIPNPALLRTLPQRSDPEIEDTFPHPIDGEPVQVSTTWERTAGRFIVHWYYDHLSPDGSVDRFFTQVQHHLAPVQTHIDEIGQAGLRVDHIFGDFIKNPYSSDSPFLIMVTTKAK